MYSNSAKPGWVMKRVLIVDDSLSTLKILIHIFKSRGYKPITAENGVQALKRLGELHPGGCDLVITDMEMPVMNGLELLKRLRRKMSDLPVIGMSTNPGYRDLFISHGAREFYEKEVLFDDLIGSLSSDPNRRDLQ